MKSVRRDRVHGDATVGRLDSTYRKRKFEHVRLARQKKKEKGHTAIDISNDFCPDSKFRNRYNIDREL
jgi:hypothetical protein